MTQTNDGGATDLTTDALKGLAGELEVEARHPRHGDGLAALFWNTRSAVRELIERREADAVAIPEGNPDLNLAAWMDIRRTQIGPWADYLIREVGNLESEIARMRNTTEGASHERE